MHVCPQTYAHTYGLRVCFFVHIQEWFVNVYCGKRACHTLWKIQRYIPCPRGVFSLTGEVRVYMLQYETARQMSK